MNCRGRKRLEYPPIDSYSMSQSPVNHSGNIDTENSVTRPLRMDQLARSAEPPTEVAIPMDKGGDITVTATLSQLAQHMVHISVKDTEAWVNRTTEARREEIRGGKVPRPPNPFILYRSAYVEVAQKRYLQGNQTIISRILAESWRKEPHEVKEKYCHLARIEKENHQKAFPDYKFTTKPRKKWVRWNQTRKQQEGVRRERRSVSRTKDRCSKQPEQLSPHFELEPSMEDCPFPEDAFNTSYAILSWLKEEIPHLRDHIPSDLTMNGYQSYLSSTSASSARRILAGLVLPHYSRAICGLVILCPFLTSPNSLNIEERDDDLLTLISDLHAMNITPRSYAVMYRLLDLSHLCLPDDILAKLISQVSTIQHKPTNLSFNHLRFVAAHSIASRIKTANDQKIATSTLEALEAMVFQDLDVSKSCAVLLKAYGYLTTQLR